MLDSDDVLLLRPATPASGFAPLPPRHEAPPTLVVVAGSTADTRLCAERVLATELVPDLTSPPRQLRLEPTPRSRLR
jgi:hypothetical protein